MDRRAFVKRSCLGGVALLLDHWGTSPAYSQDLIPPAPPIHVNEPAGTAVSSLRMPGLYPGRVVEISDERSIVANRVSQSIVRQMIEQGMRELTGEKDPRLAWSKFIRAAGYRRHQDQSLGRAGLLFVAGNCAGNRRGSTVSRRPGPQYFCV